MSKESDNQLANTLLARIQSREALVGIVGLGYVGLPLALTFAEAGFPVLGFDRDDKKVQRLKAGESYIGHIPAARIASARAAGRFDATSDMSRLGEPDAILICVPTPLNDKHEPDLQYVEQTALDIFKTLRHGQLIVLESTTYPGTTARYFNWGGHPTGHKRYFLSYSPEREDPGNATWSTSKVPKIVGGREQNSTKLAVALYSAIVSEVIPVANMWVAEASKLLENIYRAVNIAMINELKLVFDKLGIDIWEVIEAAKTKPFGFQPFYPGPGWGGHCIPIDPFYLSWLARQHGTEAKFIELAGEINAKMPEHVVAKLTHALGKTPLRGAQIGILGVAYKKNVDDPRESPAFRLMEILAEQGAILSYSDPHIPVLPRMRSFDVPELTSQELTPDYLFSQDCMLIVTDHDAFDWQAIGRYARLIVDTRNAMARVKDPVAPIVKA